MCRGTAPPPSSSDAAAPRPDMSKRPKEDPVLVAGQEVVGRQVAVWSNKTMKWSKAAIAQFDGDTARHLIRFSRGSEESWVVLSKTRFQWLSKPSKNSEPNPSFREAPRGKDAVGYRVKVFWPGMARWYVGRVEGYDDTSDTHTVKYKDGDEQKLRLRHEAVLYLDKEMRKQQNKRPRASKPEQKHRKRERKNIEEESLSDEDEEDDNDDEEWKAEVEEEDDDSDAKTKRRTKVDDAVTREAGNRIVGARVAVFWADDESYYKGKLVQFDSYHKRHKIVYDDDEEEWVALQKEHFRYLTPRAASSGCGAGFCEAMTTLGAQQHSAISESFAALQGSLKPIHQAVELGRQESRVGRRLSIQSPGDDRWYAAEVLAVSEGEKLFVLYDDGEREWIDLDAEHGVGRVTWHPSGAAGPLYPGKPVDLASPAGQEAVGWRVAVWWSGDQKFYSGEITDCQDDSTWTVSYDDGDEATIVRGRDCIVWILPPDSLKATSESRVNTYRRRNPRDLEHRDSDPDYDQGSEQHQRSLSKPVQYVRKKRRRAGDERRRQRRHHHHHHHHHQQQQQLSAPLSSEPPTPARVVRHVSRLPGFAFRQGLPVLCHAQVTVKVYSSATAEEEAIGEPAPKTLALQLLLRRLSRARSAILAGLPTELPSYGEVLLAQRAIRTRRGPPQSLRPGSPRFHGATHRLGRTAGADWAFAHVLRRDFIEEEEDDDEDEEEEEPRIQAPGRLSGAKVKPGQVPEEPSLIHGDVSLFIDGAQG